MYQPDISRHHLPFEVSGGLLERTSETEYPLSVLEISASLSYGSSRAAGVLNDDEGMYVLCTSLKTPMIRCNDNLWILPEEGSEENALCISGRGWKTAKDHPSGMEVALEPGMYVLTLYPARPSCNILGQELSLVFEGGETLKKTYARFYWDTLLPTVIEKTDALAYPISMGYVLSTLKPGEYAGTYPDVDHEFQCKGRLALPDDCWLSVAKRMMDLQFKLMREDPTGLNRNPCAIQPNGDREYHVRRDSLDHRENAEMFLVTGNVEILETAWLYYAATKNKTWLCSRIEDLEGAASLIEHLTDRNGKLWSDVYYEDQVIKDGMECMSAAMAAHGLILLAELEDLLERPEQQEHYQTLSAKIAGTLIKPLPHGFWDEENKHFADWIDRNGHVHDHIHLLANCLPVLFGFANGDQAEDVKALIQVHFKEFQRFPTFLSPRIADYTQSEIGSGGPYDLCAAGRYWCWDSAYWASLQRGDVILRQLMQVAHQAETDGYRMGERYDMNHVYYQDGKNWHGAPHYYEYPCVFIWVLVHDYLGVSCGIDTDLVIKPLLASYGKVRLDVYQLEYEYAADSFVLWNRSEKERTFLLDLGALYPKDSGKERLVCVLAVGERRRFEFL